MVKSTHYIIQEADVKAVIQRVSEASVTIGHTLTASIQEGFLVLLGVGHGDSTEDADRIAHKMTGLRIFPDGQGKTNLSLHDVGGSLLIVSQFTLYADTRKGNRPSFINAANPEDANALYEYFIKRCREEIPDVQCGVFGADMKVSLVNDGPFTIILD